MAADLTTSDPQAGILEYESWRWNFPLEALAAAELAGTIAIPSPGEALLPALPVAVVVDGRPANNRGRRATTDRHLRIFNRVEELRAKEPGRSKEQIYNDVALETLKGKFSSPLPPEGWHPPMAWKNYEDSSYRKDRDGILRPVKRIETSKNIRKIHDAIAKKYPFRK